MSTGAAAEPGFAWSVDKGLAKARTSDSMQAVAKLTRMVDGRPRIVSDPLLLVPVGELAGGASAEAAYRAIIAGYQRTLETDRQYLPPGSPTPTQTRTSATTVR
jgi:hypothetical protein